MEPLGQSPRALRLADCSVLVIKKQVVRYEQNRCAPDAEVGKPLMSGSSCFIHNLLAVGMGTNPTLRV